MAEQPTQMLALVDWDTARRFAWVNDATRRTRLRSGRAPAEERLAAILGVIAGTTREAFPRETRVTCDVRLYHGWHRGTTTTDDFREIKSAADRAGRLIGHAFHVSRVDLATALLFASETFDSEPATLFATVRRRDDGDDEQKMVDTALSADLLHWARRRSVDRQSLIFVLADDDDLYPPVALSNHWGVRARLVRTRAEERHMPWMARYLLRPTDEQQRTL